MLPLYRTPTHVFNYDEIPAGYYYQAMLKGSPIQRFWHREKFTAVANMIRNGERVLDIGCGPGSFLSILAETHPDCHGVGVDIASSQIEFAAREIAPRFNGRVNFKTIHPDDTELPFEPGTFDVVTSIEVIEHLHPYLVHKILERAKRMLKPNGRIIITTPNYRSLWPVIERVLEMRSPVKYHEQHINKFTPNSLVKFLEGVGLEVSQINSLFVVAPFTASLSQPLAHALHTLERASHLRVGSLLIAEALKNPNFS